MAHDPDNLEFPIESLDDPLNPEADENSTTADRAGSLDNGTDLINVRTNLEEDPLPIEKRVGTKDEKAALLRETTGAFKSLTKSSIIILATCAIGAIAQGWTQESIVGANLDWPTALGIATLPRNSSTSTASAKNSTILWHAFDHSSAQDNHKPDKGLNLFSLVNAITYFAACLLGAWVTDPLTYVWGRRFALLCAGLCTLAGPIGASYSRTWVQLFFCRVIQGIGVGAKSAVVPVVEAEVFQPEIRGMY